MMKLLLVLMAAALTSGCAGRLFYYPDHNVYQMPKDPHEEVTFVSGDGTKLSGWFVPAMGQAIGTVIHFHGNAQNMTAHYSYVDWLPVEGFNVFVFDYRGYGKSGGPPDRQGVYEDCLAAIQYVCRRKDVDRDKLLIFGQSLGGANALAVMGENRFPGVKAVAADSPFYSYRSVARDKIDDMPVLWLLKWPLSFLLLGNSHSPGPVVANISPTPLLLIHGNADQVIPYHHSQWLFQEAKEPKTLLTVKGGGHTTAISRYGLLYRRQLVDFFKRALEAAK
ncbi:MAG: alpha/beta hydrolase [Verrucomicrobia bacterium]|nr:alpha/beta hydrolase [Verrucomicrobiota bacterium]